MRYSDADMKAMALGEIAAIFISLLAAVVIWTEMPLDSKIGLSVVSGAGFLVSANLLLMFVHWGYSSEKDSS